MKRLLIPILLVFASCGGPKNETTAADSTTIGALAADRPATTNLSFDDLVGYSIDSKTVLTDSLNYFLLNGNDDLKRFTVDPGTASPDFLINYVVGIVGKESSDKGLVTDSVRVNGSSIEVFFRQRAQGPSVPATRPVRLIAIEKRTDVISIRFYLNGTPNGEIIL